MNVGSGQFSGSGGHRFPILPRQAAGFRGDTSEATTHDVRQPPVTSRREMMASRIELTLKRSSMISTRARSTQLSWSVVAAFSGNGAFRR